MPIFEREVLVPELPTIASLAPRLHGLFPRATLTLRLSGERSVEITETRERWVNDFAQSVAGSNKRRRADSAYSQRLITLRGDRSAVLKVRAVLLDLPHAVPLKRKRNSR